MEERANENKKPGWIDSAARVVKEVLKPLAELFLLIWKSLR